MPSFAHYIPEPSDSLSITENGTYDVTRYGSANVNVSGGGGHTGTLTLINGGSSFISVGFYSVMFLSSKISATLWQLDNTCDFTNDNFVVLFVTGREMPTSVSGLSVLDSFEVATSGGTYGAVVCEITGTNPTITV